MEGWFWNQFRVSESESHSVMSNFLWSHGLYSPCNFPGQNTGVGSLSLLQGIFPIQGLHPGLPHCTRILYQLSHKENPCVRGVDFESFVDTAAIKRVQHVIHGLNRIILDTCSPQIPSTTNLCKFTSALVTSACLKWKHVPAGFKIKLKL